MGWERGGKWNILQGESNLHQPLGAGGVLGGSVIKNPPAIQETAYNARDVGLIPGSGRAPGEGNGNSLQYSCLENPVDRGQQRPEQCSQLLAGPGAAGGAVNRSSTTWQGNPIGRVSPGGHGDRDTRHHFPALLAQETRVDQRASGRQQRSLAGYGPQGCKDSDTTEAT